MSALEFALWLQYLAAKNEVQHVMAERNWDRDTAVEYLKAIDRWRRDHAGRH